MIANRARIALVAAFAAGAALGAAALPANAQTYGPDDSAVGVGGVAVYSVPPYVRQPTTGAWVEPDTVSLVVPLGDLDLSTDWGASMAARRIASAAKAVCQKVEDVYPKDVQSEHGCYTSAVRAALAQAQALARYPILAWGYH